VTDHEPAGPRFRFSVYVVGGSARAEAAMAQFEALCADLLEVGAYRIEVVDVVRDPDAAEAARVIATPTVVREEPLPRRTVVGDLSAWDQVRAVLGISADARRRSPQLHGAGPTTHDAVPSFGRRRSDGAPEAPGPEDQKGT
jgi:circadian clock protein KaiB